MTFSKIETKIPDWLWSPRDYWSRWKGFGRIPIFIGVMAYFGGFSRVVDALFALGLILYGIGLLGMRMEVESKRKA
jgi:hypothetical protein